MKRRRSVLGVISDGRRPYIILNLFYYGLVACAMAYTALDSSLQQVIWDAVGESFGEGVLAQVLDAYTTERVLPAIGLTFGINLAVGSFLSITLPSLVIPFSGLLVAGLRAVMWGVVFFPQTVEAIGLAEVATGFLLVILLLLEGQGYVLAALGAYLHGTAFLWPQRVGAEGRGEGYLHGLREQGRVYLLVVAVLLVAAVYEVALAMVALPALR